MIYRFLVLFTLLLVSATPAHAGEAHVTGLVFPDGTSLARVVFNAYENETNRVLVTADGSALIIRDAGAAITAGNLCTPIDPQAVRCAPPATTSRQLEISLRDGQDVLISQADERFSVDAGPGDDIVTASGVLRGGRGDDKLNGGPHADTILGGAGRDEIHAGAGDDIVSGDASDSLAIDAGGFTNIVDGGEGSDTVVFSARKAGIRADLATQLVDPGTPQEQKLAGIENIQGGSGDDVLLGDNGPNKIEGLGGNDTISGLGGNDTVVGGGGVDTVRGGDGSDRIPTTDPGDRAFGEAGNDTLESSSPNTHLDGGAGDDLFSMNTPPATLRCGDGLDTVTSQGTSGGLLRECERIGLGVTSIAVVPKLSSRKLGLFVECAGAQNHCVGSISVTLRRGMGHGTLYLGQIKFDLQGNRRGTRYLRLKKGARKVLKHIKRPSLVLAASGNSVSADDAIAGWRVRLSRAG